MSRRPVNPRQFYYQGEVIKAIRGEAKRLQERVRYMDKSSKLDEWVKDYVHDKVDDVLARTKGYDLRKADTGAYDSDELLDLYRDVMYAGDLETTRAMGRVNYADRFKPIKETIETELDEETQQEFWHSMGRAMEQFGKSHSKYKYDIMDYIKETYLEGSQADIDLINQNILEMIEEAKYEAVPKGGFTADEKRESILFRDKLRNYYKK